MAENLATSAGTLQVGEFSVNRIGLGTNRITDTPEARALLKRAVELGVNFIDTAHRYTNGASETTIGKTFEQYPQGLVVATKGGVRAEGPAGAPEQLRADLEESLQRLQVDSIDLYQLHRVDPKAPLEESVGALRQFQAEGKIRHIGLSEVTVEQIERARKIAKIVSVQNQYNVVVRTYEAEVDYCTEHGVVFIPWFPLGGLAGGAEKVNELLTELAAKYGASAQQVALAWLLKRSPVMLPIPGTLSPEHLEANLRAGSLGLSNDDFEKMSELGLQAQGN
jgi:pyridoxine 4-dehydrogenase